MREWKFLVQGYNLVHVVSMSLKMIHPHLIQKDEMGMMIHDLDYSLAHVKIPQMVIHRRHGQDFSERRPHQYLR